MDQEKDINTFVNAIRRDLPRAAEQTDRLMIDLGFEPREELNYLWVEAFADVTNNIIRNRDKRELDAHFHFFSEQLEHGSQSVKNCIDVSYVENLMWSLEARDKKWAWPQIPKNLQALYIAIWGEPDF